MANSYFPPKIPENHSDADVYKVHSEMNPLSSYSTFYILNSGIFK